MTGEHLSPREMIDRLIAFDTGNNIGMGREALRMIREVSDKPIVAIVYSAQVNGKLESGDTEDARRLAASANNWANASLIIGLVVTVLYIILLAIGAIDA